MEENIKVSLFASAVRPQLFDEYMASLENSSVSYEVVFAGHCTPEEVKPIADKYPMFRYIHTGRIKPSQAYHVALLGCVGETVIWTADDCAFVNDVVGKAYSYWKSKKNEKLILSIQTRETGYGNMKGTLFDMKNHTFLGFRKNTPLMAPLGLISRKFLMSLGGIDRRYVAGQYENSAVMSAYADGGTVEIFGDEHCFIDIDHLKKSIQCGECTDERGFLKRPFATGYQKDRQVLESSWYRDEKFLVSTNSGPEQVKVVSDLSKLMRYDEFEPFEDADILTKSQSNRGKWNE